MNIINTTAKYINESKNIDKELERIAKDILKIKTLKARNSDELDFYNVSVWDIKKALMTAYQLGTKF